MAALDTRAWLAEVIAATSALAYAPVSGPQSRAYFRTRKRLRELLRKLDQEAAC